MEPSRKRNLKILVFFVMLLPGLVAWLLYKALVACQPDLALGLYAERKAIAGIVAAFAFTMAGFLAAIITLMFNHYESGTFFRYRKQGYFEVFLFFYYISICCLMMTCFLSLFCYTNTKNPLSGPLFALLVGSFVNNVVHIFLISLAIYTLSVKAIREDA